MQQHQVPNPVIWSEGLLSKIANRRNRRTRGSGQGAIDGGPETKQPTRGLAVLLFMRGRHVHAAAAASPRLAQPRPP